MDDLVDVQVGNEQAIEDVQPVEDDLQPVLEPPLYCLLAELEPLLEQSDEIESLRPAIEADDVHVHTHRALERGCREQV